MTPKVIGSGPELISALDEDPSPQPVFLTPKQGLSTLGGAAWAAVTADARAARPDRNFRLICDAAASPGAVIAALDAGCGAVRFTGPKEVAAKLADIATAKGALLFHDPEDTLYGVG